MSQVKQVLFFIFQIIGTNWEKIFKQKAKKALWRVWNFVPPGRQSQVSKAAMSEKVKEETEIERKGKTE